MAIIKRILNSFIFWGAWIIIPLLMEIWPALKSWYSLVRRRRRMRKNPLEKPALYPEISLIIPIYNSADTLELCLRSVYDSTYPNDAIRVFLVNNESPDESFKIYTQCQEKFPELAMQWLNAAQGKSRALNLALYNSKGKYIINMDSDGFLEPHALENLVTKFEANPDLNCMTGAILTDPAAIGQRKGFFSRLLCNLEFMEYAQAFLAGRCYSAENDSIYTLSGAFSAFRKSAILSSRLYNTDTICEDTQLTFQMRYLQNTRVDICENAIFFTDPIEDFNKLYTQRQRWQRGSLEVAKMFSNGPSKLNLRHAFKDVNVKTLLYDHTFAFPRMIWYLALFCLIFMGYSGRALALSMGAIMVLYIIVGYFYFFSVSHFLKSLPDVRSFYRKHWWVVPLLPFFNLVVFFIRIAGIVNSIGTSSVWRTLTLKDERAAFSKTFRQDMAKVKAALSKVAGIFNRPQDEEASTGAASAQEPALTREAAAQDQPSAGGKAPALIWVILAGVLLTVAATLVIVSRWVKATFQVDLSTLVNVLTGPVEGTGQQTINKILLNCVLPAVVILVALIAVGIGVRALCKRTKLRRAALTRWVAGAAAVALLCSVAYANYTFDAVGYVESGVENTTLYEDYYADPAVVAPIAPANKRNLIFIYLESMETTYASREDGGRQDYNYMPNLTRLAHQNVSFSPTKKLGGFRTVQGAGYTAAAMFTSLTGVPYAIPADASSTATGIIALGDILEEAGYTQEFICGSDGSFGNRAQLLTEHGKYRIMDYDASVAAGYIPQGHRVWWGYEDFYLFDVAKQEATKLAASGQPFNLTFLTVDTHHIDGYICEKCGHDYDSITANVVSCTDRQVADFITWCQAQPFYENTTIVMMGDHPRMDSNLVEGVDYPDRTIYNCFINAAVAPAGGVSEREFTHMDMFPTTLSALGFTIPGSRLGLGVDMFSGEKTLAEERGYDWVNGEVSKTSPYYLPHFAPELTSGT